MVVSLRPATPQCRWDCVPLAVGIKGLLSNRWRPARCVTVPAIKGNKGDATFIYHSPSSVIPLADTVTLGRPEIILFGVVLQPSQIGAAILIGEEHLLATIASLGDGASGRRRFGRAGACAESNTTDSRNQRGASPFTLFFRGEFFSQSHPSGTALHKAEARHVEVLSGFDQLARHQQIAALVGAHFEALLRRETSDPQQQLHFAGFDYLVGV